MNYSPRYTRRHKYQRETNIYLLVVVTGISLAMLAVVMIILEVLR